MPGNAPRDVMFQKSMRFSWLIKRGEMCHLSDVNMFMCRMLCKLLNPAISSFSQANRLELNSIDVRCECNVMSFSNM
jgi:hypothetical protein